MTYDEPMPHDAEEADRGQVATSLTDKEAYLGMLHESAQQGINLITGVLKKLPDSVAKDLSYHQFSCSIVWLSQALQAAAQDETEEGNE